ncbi:hypothetical protein Pla163_24080 [Planctomycetes bacterium Pla163]|uniref:Uncharacterized protein n=1 Tax=Rohdeia mirabilis TaxID=2528008 RepID=A0A518D1E5_9BACT|nr:hypothetical protein Pla163_24080 [Planctomycetes bacterium Pla163]
MWDPLTNTMSFESGAFGSIMHDHGIFNHQSDIEYGNYAADGFSVGIEGGREGVILDLGRQDELQGRYGYDETVGGGQGFASIRVEDGRLVILEDYTAQSTQPLLEDAALHAEPHRDTDSASVHIGHVYVLRITDRHDPEFERLAKFLVVGHRPNESVTIRWVRLER